jgi:hypothetical protein
VSITKELKLIIESRESELHKLRTAYGILAGLPETPQPEAALVPPSPEPTKAAEAPTIPPKPKDTRPDCDSCMGKMDSYVTKMPSGMLVQHLKCGECGNEKY